MVSWWQCIIVLFVIAFECHAIKSEYYMDPDEDPSDNDDKNYTEGRRTIQSISTNNFTSDYTDIEEEQEYTDYLQLYKLRFLNNKLMKTTKAPNSVKTITNNVKPPVNITENIMPPQKQLPPSTTKSTTFNMFQEYHYDYDENSPLKYQRQRLNLPLENLTDYMMNVNVSSNEKASTAYVNNSIRYLADFYNLVPAINALNINKTVYRGTSDSSKNIWYVPEKYPCWNLPVVYGRLGQRTLTSDIFLVFSGNLKDVKVTNPIETPVQKNWFVPEMLTSINKWCSSAPCFGDHSLCVFRNKKMSNLCVKGYRIKWPTVSEEIAIVNTLNSMRNKIAYGMSDQYSHLPPAANIKQVIYDSDLQEMAKAWLRQCLPGIDPCSSLDENYVTQLECTKCAENCCVKYFSNEANSNCIPKHECFINPIIGCLYAWFGYAGKKLTATDVECGHASAETFVTVQLIWAKTTKIGCAYGQRPNGDVRVICNFAPGAPYYVESKYYCGLIAHKDVNNRFSRSNETDDVTDVEFLSSLGIKLNKVFNINEYDLEPRAVYLNANSSKELKSSNLDTLKQIYKHGWVRKVTNDKSNGTIGMIARLVTRYNFIEEDHAKCDIDDPIYVIGAPGSRCIEKGKKFRALCYDFGDPTPGYRLAAILAPMAIFCLILYDLFSGVMRQTENY